ncbi:ribose 5-phosphate isomerase B [bacterium]|nr:ribose 5-phosphate isomerase B [bacterium]
MPIAIGSDHAGFNLKEEIKTFLSKQGIDFEDLGTFEPNPVDYPDIAFKVAEKVANGEFEKAILVCGTGIGMCMAADKVEGIRCAACFDETTARFARTHNDANILALGARILGVELAKNIVKVFISTPFSGEERHIRRIKKIEEYEKNREAKYK